MKGESHMKKENIKGVWFSKKIPMLILLLWELNDLDRPDHDSCPNNFWFLHIEINFSTAYLNLALCCGHLLSLHLTMGLTIPFLWTPPKTIVIPQGPSLPSTGITDYLSSQFVHSWTGSQGDKNVLPSVNPKKGRCIHFLLNCGTKQIACKCSHHQFIHWWKSSGFLPCPLFRPFLESHQKHSWICLK